MCTNNAIFSNNQSNDTSKFRYSDYSLRSVVISTAIICTPHSTNYELTYLLYTCILLATVLIYLHQMQNTFLRTYWILFGAVMNIAMVQLKF